MNRSGTDWYLSSVQKKHKYNSSDDAIWFFLSTASDDDGDGDDPDFFWAKQYNILGKNSYG